MLENSPLESRERLQKAILASEWLESLAGPAGFRFDDYRGQQTAVITAVEFGTHLPREEGPKFHTGRLVCHEPDL